MFYLARALFLSSVDGEELELFEGSGSSMDDIPASEQHSCVFWKTL